ncbi:MAG: tetratricopeptide repeat protein [Chthoniobacterales bacterium]
MNHRAALLVFTISFLILPMASHGQESLPLPSPVPAAKPASTPVDPVKMAQYQAYLVQSGEALEKKQYDEALKFVQKAEDFFGSNANTLNMRGAIKVGQKKFDEATNLYNEALKQNPTFFAADYNLGDISFQKKEYEKAAEHFKKMLDAYPGNELLEFMIFLSYMQLNNKPEAEKWMSTITFPSNSPSWYYAKAVWELKYGNKTEAADYLRGSAYIFGDQNQIFNETLNSVDLLPIK